MPHAVVLDRFAGAAEPAELRPMPLRLSLLLFGIPTGLMAFCFHIAIPWLQDHGVSALGAYLAAQAVPLALLTAAALVAVVHVERRPTAQALRHRLRFPPLTVRDVLRGLVLFGAMLLAYGSFAAIGKLLVLHGVIPMPATVSALADITPVSLSVLHASAGGTLHGNWPIALLYLVTLVFNIVGEEFWWRGYILPRQELVHSRGTWLVHGLLWTLFHSFKWWDLVGLLPVCLILSYGAQRYQSTWPGLIAHALFNGMGLMVVLAVVFGVL